MSTDRPNRDPMPPEEATVSNMWEIAAIRDGGEQGSDRCRPDPAAPRSRSTQGGSIMTHLRVFIGACVLLPVVGIVVSVPLGSGPVLAAADKAWQADPSDINTAATDQLKAFPSIGGAYSEKIIKGRAYQRKDELVQKQILPRATYEQIKYKIVAKQQ